MKLIKHCHEIDAAGSGSKDIVAQGALLGLVTDSRLEITHSFPFPAGQAGQAEDTTEDDEDFQLSMMRRLRQVNVDHLHVGWYQSAGFGNFLSTQLFESHVAYQTSIQESVCLIFDTAKNGLGFLSLRAYCLTPQALALHREGSFTPEMIRTLKGSYATLFQEVPVTIKNSHLVNELLLELSEQIPVAQGAQFLDLGTSDVLEGQLRQLMDSVDELNQEAIRLNKYQHASIKQIQVRALWFKHVKKLKIGLGHCLVIIALRFKRREKLT